MPNVSYSCDATQHYRSEYRRYAKLLKMTTRQLTDSIVRGIHGVPKNPTPAQWVQYAEYLWIGTTHRGPDWD